MDTTKVPDREVLRNLAALERSHRTAQAQRIRFNNRLKAQTANTGLTTQAVNARMYALWRDVETRIEWQIGTLFAVEKSELFACVRGLRGIGQRLAAGLLHPIQIERCGTPSSLWRYAGFGVRKDGRSDRLVKGEVAAYNAELRRTCSLIGLSLMRQDSPYRHLYNYAKERYVARGTMVPVHAHTAAQRYMIKRFLLHLWLTWRTMAGLPICRPYEVERCGAPVDRPADYGWPDLESEYRYA